jgi:hypothetical protein
MRHDLLQIQPDCIAQLEAARGKNSGGIRLEISIDPGAYYCIFHDHSVATFLEDRKCMPRNCTAGKIQRQTTVKSLIRDDH